MAIHRMTGEWAFDADSLSEVEQNIKNAAQSFKESTDKKGALHVHFSMLDEKG